MEVRKDRLEVRRKIGRFIGIWIIIFGLLAQPALAVTVYMQIEGPSDTIFEGNVDVPETANILYSDGITRPADNYQAVIALMEAAKIGGFNTTLKWWDCCGAGITAINGIVPPVGYWWNQLFNYNWGNGLSADFLKDKDSYLINYSDGSQMPLNLKVSKTTSNENEVLTLITSFHDGTSFKPISATVKMGNQSIVTDQNGQATISFPSSGNHKLYAEKAGYVKSNRVNVEVQGSTITVDNTTNTNTNSNTDNTNTTAPTATLTTQALKLASKNAINHLRKKQSKDGSLENPATSAWVAMALAALSKKKIDIKRGKGKSLLQNLASYNPKLLTDYARQILAVVALGKNPRYFGRKNLVWKMRDLFYKNDPNLLNDDNFTALALLAAKTPNRRLARKIINSLVSNQNPDGGFSYSKSIKASDVDDTAATIQTLAAAKKQGYANVDEAINKAINFLKSAQKDNGGFGYAKTGGQSNPNSMSTAWAIQAIVAAGQDPAKWTKSNGATPLSYLVSCQNADGSFSYTVGGAKLTLAAAYAIPALQKRPWPINVWRK